MSEKSPEPSSPAVRASASAEGASGPAEEGVRHAVARAALDVWRGLERVLEPGPKALGLVFLGLLVGWWIYVPLHELLHAFACMGTGGEVTRLEIAREYGGAFYAAIFPFVVGESDYAGRLSGFDTYGNDWIYLATDLGPYLLTLFPGVYLLRRAVDRIEPFFYGFWLPFALAPFLSLTGDAYEIGSIVITQVSPWAQHAELLRSDDLLLWIHTHGGQSGIPWGGAALAFGVGLLWALLTYGLGSVLSRLLGQGPIPAPPKREPKSAKAAGDTP